MLTIAPLLAPIPGPHDETDRLGDEIAELAVHLEAASARLLDLIREFDAQGGWAVQGARSCAEWLSYRIGLDRGAAREKVRVARALGGLPKLAAALARGELSYAKVRALTRVATPETEDRLLGVGRAGTAAHVERIVRGWRRVDRAAEAREAGQRHAGRSLRVYTDDDGMMVFRGRLEPEVGAVVLRALEAARDALHQRASGAAEVAETPGVYPFDTFAETLTPASGGPTAEQRQADALALVAETVLHHGIEPGAPGERYQVVVHGASSKADAFSGSQTHRGKSQSPVAWMAGWRETETLKPIDEAITRMVSESPGRNESERRGGLERLQIRRPSLTVKRRRQHDSSHLAEAAGRSGGVRATAR
jgi:hypothetical protein